MWLLVRITISKRSSWHSCMATRTRKRPPKTPQADEVKEVKAEIVSETDEQNAIEPVEQEKPLTAEEKELLAELENKIHTSLNTAAFALKEISDKKLYRETHKRFEDYCEEQLQISRRFASYQINFARIIEEFKKEQDVPFLPTSESQVRALAKLEPEERKTIWLKSCQEAGDKVPSRETVQSIVKEAKQKEKTKYEPIEEGACVLVVRASKDSLKDRVNYWGFVENRTKSDTYTVVFPDKSIRAIPREALREVELESNKLALKKELFEQLKPIYDSKESKESVVVELLQYFGKKQEATFTTLEQEILNLVQNALKSPSEQNTSA